MLNHASTNTVDGCTVSNYVIRCYSENNDANLAHGGWLDWKK